MAMKQTLERTIIAIATLVLSACAGSVSGVGGESHFICAVDADCPSGNTCVNKVCQPVSGTGGQHGSGGSAGMDSSVAPPIPTKLDLLFMIDNSSSMADKQAVLKEAVPDLVNRLVSPHCVDYTTSPPTFVASLSDPAAQCPAGSVREFAPIRDIHIGVITSSLGAHGATNVTLASCLTGPGIDNGELLGSQPRYLSNPAPSPPLDPQGFLNWNPDTLPGETITAFDTAFANMVTAAGQDGCGFEAQLESIYRFLADPAPPMSIVLQPCSAGSTSQCAFRSGIDQKVLDQRAAFLRPDSLVAVMMLTDENDCSVRDEGQYYYVLQQASGSLPAGSSQCDANPNDPCCYSCGAAKPSSCQDGCAGRTTANPDKMNLRCYREKQRFGMDFLYPTQRYVNALSMPSICTSNPTLDPNDPKGCPDLDGDGRPDVVQNPVFAGSPSRPKSFVFLAGILGVPWQDIAKDPSDAVNLTYQDYDQMVASGAWTQILGDLMNPAGPVEPSDPHMVEATAPRGNIPGVSATRFPTADAKNGHEYLDSSGGDLEYACIFTLPTPLDCATAATNSCDCVGTTPITDQNPLCQASDNTYGNVQYFAKAYPAIRELQVLKDFGKNSVVTSICARNLAAATQPDYGYRPAMDALVSAMRSALTP